MFLPHTSRPKAKKSVQQHVYRVSQPNQTLTPPYSFSSAMCLAQLPPPRLTGGVRAGPRPAPLAPLSVRKLGVTLARCHTFARGAPHDATPSALLLVWPKCSRILCPHFFQKHRSGSSGSKRRRCCVRNTEHRQVGSLGRLRERPSESFFCGA